MYSSTLLVIRVTRGGGGGRGRISRKKTRYVTFEWPPGVERADEEVLHNAPPRLLTELRDQGKASEIMLSTRKPILHQHFKNESIILIRLLNGSSSDVLLQRAAPAGQGLFIIVVCMSTS